jgi:hypothetical protein
VSSGGKRLWEWARVLDWNSVRKKGVGSVAGEPDLEKDDLDEAGEEELWLENPVMGAEVLLRFFRIRQLLQP